MRRWLVEWVALAAAAVAAAGCTKPNPAYCDDTTPCVSGAACVDNQCGDAPDGGAPDGNVQCTGQEDCNDPAFGVCDDTTMQCRPCEGPGECVGRADGLEACVLGQCVECATSDDCPTEAPVCDASSQCVPCSEDSECEGRGPSQDVGVCDDGACPGAAMVSIVDAAATCGVGDGSPTTPYCDVGEALDAVDTTGKALILVRSGDYPPFRVTGGDTVKIFGKGNPSISLGGSDLDRVEIDGAGTSALIRGLTVTGATNAGRLGVNCHAGATCTLLKMDVSYNATGILADGAGLLVVERTTIHHNAAGGLRTSASDFQIVNNLIYTNGTSSSTFGGVKLTSSSTELRVFRHNTVFNNKVNPLATGAAGAVSCQQATTLTSNVLWDNDPPIVTAGCTVEYSVIDDAVLGVLNMNTPEDPKFESTDVDNPDLHLKSGSPAIDTARGDGAPAVDYFGQERVAPPDMGADEFGLP